MKILITGICGFVGSVLATTLKSSKEGIEIWGVDNLIRPGSETNRLKLKSAGIHVVHGDLRLESDVDGLPDVDWVIDAAANPSVLAGVDGRSSSRQIVEHNLRGTLNILEYCRSRSAGLILLSTSRVYSIRELSAIPIKVKNDGFVFDENAPSPPAVSSEGVQEGFATSSPLSLYGSTKLASEVMALEYSNTFNFPIWIDRCGMLAGAGQMGTAEQGIISFWLHAHAAQRPLRFIGYEGKGYQVRDAFHPEDLAVLLEAQMTYRGKAEWKIFNVGGGRENSISLAQLNLWCNHRFGDHPVSAEPEPRQFDIPWLIMDSSRVQTQFSWSPRKKLSHILDEITAHVRKNPDWLHLTGAV